MGGKGKVLILFAGIGIIAFTALMWLQNYNTTQVQGQADSVSGGSSTLNAKVTVGSPIATIPTSDFGINTAVWDWNLLSQSTEKLVKQAGIHMFRYPGGSTADLYHWQTNSIEPSSGITAAPKDAFTHFIQYVRKSQSQALITVNYGTGTPQEAAAWVKYAEVTHHYDVQYWEIGNEVYGNGTYGTKWEADSHAHIGPQAYADNALKYIKAMKQVDPAAKIGVDLIAPGQWPSNQQPNWNRTVLSTVGKSIDFVDVHWYPQQPGRVSDKGLLNSTKTIPNMMSQLRGLIRQYCGQNANNVKVLIGETNSVAKNPGKQTTSIVNALFLVNDLMTWLQQGAVNIDWWDLHNSENQAGNPPAATLQSQLYGSRNYGDYGILSTGPPSGPPSGSQSGSQSRSQSGSQSNSQSSLKSGSQRAATEPPLNTPFPTYYAMKLLSRLGKPGDTMLHVQVQGGNSAVSAYAVQRKGGTVGVLLVNRDRQHVLRVHVSIPHFHPFPITRTYSYGPKHESKIPSGFGLSSVTVPPYSMKLLVLRKWW